MIELSKHKAGYIISITEDIKKPTCSHTHHYHANIGFYHTPKPVEIAYTHMKSVLTFIQSVLHSQNGSVDVMS